MLNQSFINKYRPRNINEIVGQGDSLDLIKNGLKSKKLPQLICVTGEAGVGKTSLAFSISRAINCKSYDYEQLLLCGKCACCIAGDRNNTAFNFIPCSENGVSQEELSKFKTLASIPFFSFKYRVLFFDEIHEWFPERQAKLTSLLDTLPTNAFVICATYKPDKLEEAFVSRFQIVKMQIPGASDIKNLLLNISKKENASVREETINKIVKENWSSPRTAIVALEREILKLNNSLSGTVK